jgi:hypothetical protein
MTEGHAGDDAMELTLAEQRRLKKAAKYHRRCERHPVICRFAVWAWLVLAGIHGFNCAASSVRAYSLATAEDRNLGNGFVCDTGVTSNREMVDELLTAHVLLTEYWQAFSRAGVRAMSSVFFAVLFFCMRSALRDQALLAKLNRRLEEMTPAGEGA